MSAGNNQPGCGRVGLGLLLGGLALWLGWRVLVGAFTFLSLLAINALLGLEYAFFGVLGAGSWVLLGLLLGGAAGMAAAGRRYRLGSGLVWMAAGVAITALALAGLTNVGRPAPVGPPTDEPLAAPAASPTLPARSACSAPGQVLLRGHRRPCGQVGLDAAALELTWPPGGAWGGSHTFDQAPVTASRAASNLAQIGNLPD